MGDAIKNQQGLYQCARCGDREGVEAQVEENYEMEPSKYKECWEECCQTAETPWRRRLHASELNRVYGCSRVLQNAVSISTGTMMSPPVQNGSVSVTVPDAHRSPVP